MADIIYVSVARRAEYSHFLEDGDTPRMSGTMVEVFVPDERKEDLDRNDTHRRELTKILEAAVSLFGG